MCDSPAAQSTFIPSDCTSNFLSSSIICGQFHHLDGSSLEVSSVVEGPISFGSCTNCNTSCPHKIQLEQDVQRLQQQLQEEMEVHAILKNAIEKKNSKFSCPPCLPLHAQELLSTIAFLEITISKLEQEIVSLNFQLSQERNERRLAEYRLRHTASQSISDAVKSTALFNEKKDSTMDTNNVQTPEAMKLPKGMPPKGLWDSPSQLSEEMVRCMKNIFISLTDAAMPSKSTLESQSSPVSPCGNLSNSSWWSSSERSMISSWVQSPQVDVQSNPEVLALDKNAFDPYKVHGKLSWADIGNYSSATEVSWMSVGKKQLEYASGVLRRFR
uniref:Uncharacterized protein LOC105646110 isoform X3 n=1 Tax=Rhizophora mucronata TaxID=61149 RepID=A0A2P2M2G7_RHIMU